MNVLKIVITLLFIASCNNANLYDPDVSPGTQTSPTKPVNPEGPLPPPNGGGGGTTAEVACHHPLAIDYDAAAWKQVGPCQFQACANPEYAEFEYSNIYLEYIERHGGNITPNNELCLTKVDEYNPVCSHPLAFNNGVEGKCLFKACATEGFYEHEVYLSLKKLFGDAVSHDPTECKTAFVYKGCTDSLAMNHDEIATLDDKSCKYQLCTDSRSDDYGTTENQAILQALTTYAATHELNIDDLVALNTCAGYEEVLGCKVPGAIGYNADADKENGSCKWDGCLDEYKDGFSAELLAIVQAYATTHGGTPESYLATNTCTEKPILGCTVTGAIGFNSNANQDNGSCKWDGCLDEQNAGYTKNIKDAIDAYSAIHGVKNYIRNSTCIVKVEGCMQRSANNTTTGAEVDNGSCQWDACIKGNMYEGHDELLLKLITQYASVHGGVAQNYINPESNLCKLKGCMIPGATNYNKAAQVDNGSCRWKGCIKGNNYAIHNPQLLALLTNYAKTHGGNAQSYIGVDQCKLKGCTHSNAVGYNPQAEVENGSCKWNGCINGDTSVGHDAGLLNFLKKYAQTHGGTAQSYINKDLCKKKGCLAPRAKNPTAGAQVDDGSCRWDGCAESAGVKNPDAALLNIINAYIRDHGGTKAKYLSTNTCIPFTRGCTEASARNTTNPKPDIDNGSCRWNACLNKCKTGYVGAAAEALIRAYSAKHNLGQGVRTNTCKGSNRYQCVDSDW